MNRKKINERIIDLNEQAATIKSSFLKDSEYKKLDKQWHAIEKKMHAIRAKVLKTHAYQLAQIDEEIRKLKLQKQARTKKVLSPSAFGSEFNKWWLTVFIGVSSYSRRQLIWISDDKQYCLMKLIRTNQPGVDWYLYRVSDTTMLHHTEGRLNAIKIAAMETKMQGVKIKF